MRKQESPSSVLQSLSSELAGVVERVGPSVARVDDGSRLTATGVLWSDDGLVVTTSHGVERDENLAIELADGSRHAASVVGRDPDTDLAVLRVSATGLPAVQTAETEDVKVGHLVLALGRPGTSGLQATIGIISARLDTERAGTLGYILHTDAVLYPGFSGGALVDVSGRMVGLTNLMYGRGNSVAIGVPVVRQVAEALLAHGGIPRGYLGVRTQLVALPEGLRQGQNLTQAHALLIVQVETGSPAEKGGLLLGDILVRINGQDVPDVDQLRRLLRGVQAGQAVALQILRGGALQEISVPAGVAP
jgi:S1-C subfamily serine protease